ncbi:MAG: acetyl-CoA carboxylase biotin carboxylase subunit [Pseudomonadota bacterium]
MTKRSEPINTLLIANRGEIACRVMRTAKAMGIRTIAVYSEADAAAPHVKMADDAQLIGPAPVSESYLDASKIIAAAQEKNADAIHPGYGFLSENAAFAQACADAGITFVGPNPDAIDLMGDKAKAKRRMIEAGVPCVPGYQGEDQTDDALMAEARNVGFPLMVKAAAGGGGRGMRLVEKDGDLKSALSTARSEAINAFGSGDLILEKAIIEPRHVEIQVFADRHGNVVHFGERDCSVQRRHQKVLEEAPCPVMTGPLREEMGAAAVKAARDINYVGAGTVEFLLDANGSFYFLEMNTRLQVEHPVTEMVTGVDLVALQLRVAQGMPLDLSQEEISLRGHAIEARLYAEDPGDGFLPATGPIAHWSPATGEGVRIDAGVASGGAVSPFYDPMIAKVIAHGASRDEARAKLVRALKETTLFGTTTNKHFLIEALEKKAFRAGAATTAFIAENFRDEDLTTPTLTPRDAIIAAVLQYSRSAVSAAESAIIAPVHLTGWSSASAIRTPFRYAAGDAEISVGVEATDTNHFHAFVDGEATPIDVAVHAIADTTATLEIGGSRVSLKFLTPPEDPSHIFLDTDNGVFSLSNLNQRFAVAEDAAGAGSVTAPMHGLLLEVFAEAGAPVKRGDRLAILEAMKMQHEILAPIDGSVSAVHAAAGAQIAADALLLEIEADPS